MTIRVAKISLVFAVAVFYSLVVLNNTTDYDSNYQFVRHVLMMDTTFPGNRGMWRAMNSPVWHTVLYASIIVWESITMILSWLGGIMMLRALHATPTEFDRAKRVAISALTLSLLMWFIVFLSVGGEWFLMWQSRTWNGQDAAFRMFTVVGIILLFLVQPENEAQP
jgi:predicted small integral membrane protein